MASYLVDTNVLLRAVQKAAPEHAIVVSAIAQLTANGVTIYVAPQVLIGFWVVATRPIEVNGFGWDPAFVAAEINRILSQFPLLDERPTIFNRWFKLVSSREIKGRKAHDVRLVALMQSKRITHLLTFNVEDFRGYTSIAPVHPDEIV